MSSPSVDAGGPANPAARRVLFFVFFTVFLDLIGFGIIIPLLPLYVQSMGGSAETVGFILASFSLTQLVATPFLGRLSDRVGRRPVILLSLAGNALSMVVFALATKLSLLPLLFASRIVAGATAGNLATCQAAIADVTHGDERAKGMGRLGAGIGLGLVLGPVAGGSLSQFGAWVPPLGAAALALLDLAGAFLWMPETRRFTAKAASPAAPVASVGDILSERRVVLVIVLYFLTFLCMTNLQVALALLAKLRLNWGGEEVGHVFGLFGLIMLVIQGGLIGRMARAFGRQNLVVVGAALLGVGLGTVSVATRAVPLVGGLVLVGIGLGVIQPLLSTLASEFAGETHQGAVLGFAQSAGGLARAIGPVGAGFLYARVAPGAPFVAGAVAAGVAVVIGVALKLLSRPEAPDVAT